MDQDDNELLADLLLRWEELFERGQDAPATELAKDHPELIPELDRRIKALKEISWLDKPLDDDPRDDDPPEKPKASVRTLANRYRLDELIAEGGFAQVYRAYDTELQRTVAVKIPKPSKLESKDDFLAEARRVARLKHESIVPVYDVGVDNDTCYIVTEYVEGGSLADRLVSGRIPRDQAIRWVSEIADGLEYAHLNGVIHRDLKPANILVDHHGRAKLADFGISHSGTKNGSLAPSLGTLRYMSPEQLEGKPSDHRSDLYSLGVVLYEVMTGGIPYSSSEPNVLRKEIVHGRPAALDGLPTHLRSICEKALSKSPHQRHQSAAQFASELRRVSVRPGSFPWRALIALPLLACIIAGGYFLLSSKKPHTSQTSRKEDSKSDFEYTLGPEGASIKRYVGESTDIVIPETIEDRAVVAIGSDAFNGRHFIKTIRFPKTILGIGNASFAGCNDLQSLELPPELRHIGFNAFQFCVDLKQVEIPASVTKIGGVVFFGCRNIEAINVHPDNIQYASVDGILYDKEVKTLITCPPAKKGVVEIPSSVTGILGWSFAGCDLVTRIIIPRSVTDIHQDAFRDFDVARVQK